MASRKYPIASLWYITPTVEETAILDNVIVGDAVHYHEFGQECNDKCFVKEQKEETDGQVRQ